MTIKKGAHAAIHTASAAAAGVALSPIPFSDTALLIPIQITMITSIYKVYGHEISKGFLEGAVRAMTISTIGKGLAGNLLKMVPGAGTVAGGAINAGVAVAFTEAIGFGVANAFEKGELDTSADLMKVLKQIGKSFNKMKKA